MDSKEIPWIGCLTASTPLSPALPSFRSSHGDHPLVRGELRTHVRAGGHGALRLRHEALALVRRLAAVGAHLELQSELGALADTVVAVERLTCGSVEQDDRCIRRHRLSQSQQTRSSCFDPYVRHVMNDPHRIVVAHGGHEYSLVIRNPRTPVWSMLGRCEVQVPFSKGRVAFEMERLAVAQLLTILVRDCFLQPRRHRLDCERVSRHRHRARAHAHQVFFLAEHHLFPAVVCEHTP
mmetsp:Transcript_11806/g.20795  ORF Transcript_11806/g.20795 Transcript_11806/m.20795 type:complete len:237 (+) Transcript_11806:283-993(+)